VTIPLATQAASTTRQIVGLDRSAAMLEAARKKTAGLEVSVAQRVRWVEGDLRSWRDGGQFDLIIAPCGTLCHLLALEDQLAAWQTAYLNLNPGGRFVADVPMAEFPVLAESLQIPRRAILQIDNDTSRSDHNRQRRLVRYKAVTYRVPQQRASVRYLYDAFQPGAQPERFLSDYEHHVYFPRELELLFRHAGFTIESVWGGYQETPLQNNSRSLVMVGDKREPTGSE
jgi:SAM-dependent methyltransferase